MCYLIGHSTVLPLIWPRVTFLQITDQKFGITILGIPSYMVSISLLLCVVAIAIATIAATVPAAVALSLSTGMEPPVAGTLGC